MSQKEKKIINISFSPHSPYSTYSLSSHSYRECREHEFAQIRQALSVLMVFRSSCKNTLMYNITENLLHRNFSIQIF